MTSLHPNVTPSEKGEPMGQSNEHEYSSTIEWTGNLGNGTSSYTSYGRDYRIVIAEKAPLLGSADPQLRGDPSRHNPEDLFVASLSSCHMLFYLHLCAAAGINVIDYRDNPVGTMVIEKNGGGRFSEVVLRPEVKISKGDPEKAQQLHHNAHELCFIANSVSCSLDIEGNVSLV
jgi:organic hydroperoxide reductase OsmC/OhrA